MPQQIYEKYWEITFEWTDFNGAKFLLALATCIDFIDAHSEPYSTALYEGLQQTLKPILKNSFPSIRKGINQLVKMGFINYHLQSYHPLAKNYLIARDNDKRKFLLSKILYSNSSFSRSVTEESSIQEINFFLKTLEHNKSLDFKYLPVIMRMPIESFPQGYATQQDLEAGLHDPMLPGFIRRKYNQISYFKNLLNKIEGIFISGEKYTLYQTETQDEITEIRSKGRDPYLQKIYKDQLVKEVMHIKGKAQCMVEGLDYPVLIASHIKPFRKANASEAFDPNNGLLLSKNIDSLFDLNYLSFDDDGKLIFYTRLSPDVKAFLSHMHYALDPLFLNSTRKQYLKFHRAMCEEINNI